MFQTLYIEQAVLDHPRVQALRRRLRRVPALCCRSYTELLNPHQQNFRLQKRRPALILARKQGRPVLAAPAGHGIGGSHDFYFSHLLNCPYDCRYCFLQGKFRSAHLVLFVNYEDYARAIQDTIGKLPGARPHFFSGYDGDSLALDPLTGFSDYFLPLFRNYPQALLELRTKSTQGRRLLQTEPAHNCVLAFSISPEPIRRALEHGVAPLQRRLAIISRLQQHGWPLGLRFDPLILHRNYRALYRQLFQQLFDQLDPNRLHSVTLGVFRLPAVYFRRISDLYPEEPLLAQALHTANGATSYAAEQKKEMLDWCQNELRAYLPAQILHVQGHLQ